MGNTYFDEKSYFSTVKYDKYGSKPQYDVFNTNTILIRIRINTTGPALHIWHLKYESSVKICSAMRPEQYWVHGRAIAVASILMCKAGPIVLIRIRIIIVFVFVLNTSYCVFEPYLSYLTVEKYDFSSK